MRTNILGFEEYLGNFTDCIYNIECDYLKASYTGVKIRYSPDLLYFFDNNGNYFCISNIEYIFIDENKIEICDEEYAYTIFLKCQHNKTVD